MKTILKTILLAFFSLNSMVMVAGPIDALQFKNPTLEKRYFSMIEELRCLKCQNSNIAGSNADLAKDLRNKVYDQIVNQGMSDQEIKNWMLARYGDFVLYKPPLKPTTYILWTLPLLLGIIGFLLLRTRLARKSPPEPLTQDQIDQMNKVIDSWFLPYLFYLRLLF